jgi:hypothetical protein
VDEKRWTRIQARVCPLDRGEWISLGTFEGASDVVYKQVVKTVNDYLDAKGLPYNQLGLYWQPKDLHRHNALAICDVDDPTERYGFDEKDFLVNHTEAISEAFVEFVQGKKAKMIALVNNFIQLKDGADQRIRDYIASDSKLSWKEIDRENWPAPTEER